MPTGCSCSICHLVRLKSNSRYTRAKSHFYMGPCGRCVVHEPEKITEWKRWSALWRHNDRSTWKLERTTDVSSQTISVHRATCSSSRAVENIQTFNAPECCQFQVRSSWFENRMPAVGKFINTAKRQAQLINKQCLDLVTITTHTHAHAMTGSINSARDWSRVQMAITPTELNWMISSEIRGIIQPSRFAATWSRQ